jgi:hypothetical protein
MSANFDPIIFYSISAALVAELVVLIVWCFALVRVRRAFLSILIFSSLLTVTLVSLNAVMAYDARTIMRLFTSREHYESFYHGFACLEAANAFVFLVGQILLVRWMRRASLSSGQKTAGVIDRLI